MHYKTIKAIKFGNLLIDLDTGEEFNIINWGETYRSGYYMLQRYNDTMWLMMKQVREWKFREYWYVNTRPLFVKSTLKKYSLF